MQEFIMLGFGRQVLELCGPVIFIGLLVLAIVVVWRIKKNA
jgi:hypothetical protein